MHQLFVLGKWYIVVYVYINSPQATVNVNGLVNGFWPAIIHYCTDYVGDVKIGVRGIL